ncbi:peptidase A24A prepilin type IV [Roseibium sp. TrichSKD4]|uniref:A24 family peptidase n=1 Tax=Roseibium sp. TrichSKD4 TaxID=744980 RepID=UPI0001E56BFB|nr:prepilin peptidase [Roseibium sp. TrichSKD4]EFO33155.1 peptidase A24A prepilin type IV [Roseibium sp. TrichSKD4]
MLAIMSLAFPFLVIRAAVSDLLTMTIPNKISIVLCVLFALYAPIVGLGWQDIGLHLAGGAVVFVVCFCMFAMNWMGGGDAKLLTAVALWFGWSADLLNFLFATAVFGMLLTLFLILIRPVLVLPERLARIEWLTHLLHPKTGIPYGLAIAAGALLVYPTSPLYGALNLP